MRNDPTPTEPPDSIDAIKSDMAADPAVRPILDAHVRDAAAEFVGLAISYANKWFHSNDPFVAERCLLEAAVWLKEAHARVDQELVAKTGPKTTVGAFVR